MCNAGARARGQVAGHGWLSAVRCQRRVCPSPRPPRQRQDTTMDVLRYLGVPRKEIDRVQYFFQYIMTYSHPSGEGLHFLNELPKSIYLQIARE